MSRRQLLYGEPPSVRVGVEWVQSEILTAALQVSCPAYDLRTTHIGVV